LCWGWCFPPSTKRPPTQPDPKTKKTNQRGGQNTHPPPTNPQTTTFSKHWGRFVGGLGGVCVGGRLCPFLFVWSKPGLPPEAGGGGVWGKKKETTIKIKKHKGGERGGEPKYKKLTQSIPQRVDSRRLSTMVDEGDQQGGVSKSSPSPPQHTKHNQ